MIRVLLKQSYSISSPQATRMQPAWLFLHPMRSHALCANCVQVWLKPEQFRKKPTTGIYDCPVYKTLTRAGVHQDWDLGLAFDLSKV